MLSLLWLVQVQVDLGGLLGDLEDLHLLVVAQVPKLLLGQAASDASLRLLLWRGGDHLCEAAPASGCKRARQRRAAATHLPQIVSPLPLKLSEEGWGGTCDEAQTRLEPAADDAVASGRRSP